MSTTVHRIHNFSAGPAVLRVPVLEEAQRDLVALPGVGMSVLEISHRSKAFEEIWRRPKPTSGRSAGAGELQGALPPGRRLTAVLDGADQSPRPGRHRRLHRHRGMGAEAVKEAKRVGASTSPHQRRARSLHRIPRQDELDLTPDAAYVHITTNNTCSAPSGARAGRRRRSPRC